MTQKDISVIIETLSEPKKYAGVTIKAKDKTWTSNKNKLFKTTEGRTRYIGDIMELNAKNSTRIAMLKSFKLVDGASGLGTVGDAGEAINWKIKGIVDI